MDGILQAARYYLALLTLMVAPSVVLYWFLIHTFVGFWRRIGHRNTYLIVLPVLIISAVVLFLMRSILLAADFGTNPYLFLLAIAAYVSARLISFERFKQIGTRMILGLPELSPSQFPGKLVTEGVYARIRNPRYVEIWLECLTVAFFTNYFAVYLLFFVLLAGIVFIVLLEEKELRSRFGEEYVNYCRRVPRFIPQF